MKRNFLVLSLVVFFAATALSESASAMGKKKKNGSSALCRVGTSNNFNLGNLQESGGTWGSCYSLWEDSAALYCSEIQNGPFSGLIDFRAGKSSRPYDVMYIGGNCSNGDVRVVSHSR